MSLSLSLSLCLSRPTRLYTEHGTVFVYVDLFRL